MKYIYGPVRSRRLGLSLGVSLAPYKICNFDCVYCQLGRTKEKACERNEYAKVNEVVGELRNWFANNPEEAKSLDYITISGLGEPTLNTKILDAIEEIRKITNLKIAVITNASLLNNAQVRYALLGVDLIVPSLNAVNHEAFTKINRPHESVKVEDVISGLIDLRREFKREIWLEIMLLGGVNDGLRQIKELKKVVEDIGFNKIQLNSPVRTSHSAVGGVMVKAASQKKLEKIKEILGDKCEIV